MNATDYIDIVKHIMDSDKKIRVKLGGYSMYPFLLPGDIAVLGKKQAWQFQKGDVLVFKNGGKLFAHRLIRINSKKELLKTKGDSKIFSDVPVQHKDVVGVVELLLRKEKTIYFNTYNAHRRNKLIADFSPFLPVFYSVWYILRFVRNRFLK